MTLIALMAASLLMAGCAGDPTPNMGDGGTSKSNLLSSNEVDVLTLPVKISFGGTTIIAKDGGTIKVTR